jgi:phage internal scaffolding protein
MATTNLVFRTQWTPRVRVATECTEPSLAQQSFKDEVDINFLLEKFKVTGQMPQGIRLPSYGDFTGITDYQSAMNALITARDAFMQLPAQMRSEFGNDPQKFMEYCSNPANAEDLVKRGLAVRPPETAVDAINNLAKQLAPLGAGADQAPTAAGPSTPSKA